MPNMHSKLRSGSSNNPNSSHVTTAHINNNNNNNNQSTSILSSNNSLFKVHSLSLSQQQASNLPPSPPNTDSSTPTPFSSPSTSRSGSSPAIASPPRSASSSSAASSLATIAPPINIKPSKDASPKSTRASSAGQSATAPASQATTDAVAADKSNKKLFPHKLWDLINENNEYLHWSDDGESIYFNRELFEANYLRTSANQFHTSKAISFVRQMNMYGFKKIDDHSYENNNFKRHNRHLLQNMSRKHNRNKRNRQRPPASATRRPANLLPYGCQRRRPTSSNISTGAASTARPPRNRAQNNRRHQLPPRNSQRQQSELKTTNNNSHIKNINNNLNNINNNNNNDNNAIHTFNNQQQVISDSTFANFYQDNNISSDEEADFDNIPHSFNNASMMVDQIDIFAQQQLINAQLQAQVDQQQLINYLPIIMQQLALVNPVAFEIFQSVLNENQSNPLDLTTANNKNRQQQQL